ncbi:hypothetical protein BACCAC_01683 [Bacteroides caccae ATCC 43185]|nr:hypothetical protein BACCAC_01683 [Bacteroides caccae ATCC 43185]
MGAVQELSAKNPPKHPTIRNVFSFMVVIAFSFAESNPFISGK